MSRRNKENNMRNMMEETIDRISDGSLDVGNYSDRSGDARRLPKDGMVDGIPAMKDDDFLDKLEKRYRKYNDSDDEEIKDSESDNSDDS